MAVWGLDVQQVRTLSSQLQQKASDIEGILSQLTTTLNNTQWSGPDAEAFRNAWVGEHTASLKRVVTALTDASSAASRNATAQEQASGN